MTDPRRAANASRRGLLRLGDLLAVAGIPPADVTLLRHTYGGEELQGPADLTPANLVTYTRRQAIGNKLGKHPGPHWLVFIAEQGLRSRLVASFDNHGEVAAERTDARRYFDLRPSEVFSDLTDRLVIEWSRDPVNWAKPATSALDFPVVEIADREAVPFPGFDRIILTHQTLRAVVEDSRYAAWRTALGAVQAVYLITDTSTGHLYVGKADGSERLLGRWARYAHDGHGGNIALRALVGADAEHADHFQYSVLRAFGPHVPTTEIDDSEAHFKRALLSRTFGLNRN